MNNNESVNDNARPHSSSLLAKALDMPTLNPTRKTMAGETSSSSSSASPAAATPCDEDFEDMVNCGEKRNNNNNEYEYEKPNTNTNSASHRIQPSGETPEHEQQPMNSFDATPVIRNEKFSLSNHPNSNRPPMINDANISPYEKRHDSIQSLGEHSANSSSDGGFNNSFIRSDEFPRHSDFTIPMSNILTPQTTRNRTRTSSTEEPPMELGPPSLVPGSSNRTPEVRSILGNTVGKKYHINERERRNANGRSANISIPMTMNYGSIPPPMAMVTTPSTISVMTPLTSDSVSVQQHHSHSNGGDSTTPHGQHVEHWQLPPTTALHNRSSSRMIPRILPVKQYSDYDNNYDDYYDDIVDDHHSNNGVCANGAGNPELQDLLPTTSSSRRREFRKSVHLQSLLVGVAFMVVWLPNNAMAPNLTEIAGFYGMNEAERDLYLGSYCALALGVFCLPLSGLIGFMADFHSRKHLFIACCVLGALSAAWSGWAPNYWSLFLARLCSGGFMSGSVPVAFSLMGDIFSKEERNAASSGLTSMMGLGIILGQVYAGEVGPTKSWQYPFFVSAAVQLVMAVVIALWVEEPVRGGKEKALQGIFKSGNKYERQLTMQGFIDSMRKNDSNWILVWQGFLTSLPWGIVFVFLNDYLSQEKGFSVQEATFLVMLFGVGCAIGGITGGYLGQLFMRGNRSFVPLYMAVSTFLGIFPFMALLNSDFPNHNGFRSKFYSILGGCIASLPAVNTRPCIINVNPPESRGAALTTANLFVTLGRGMGPSCITLLGSTFDASRQTSFNITLSFFWTVSAIQLLFLAKTLPKDQDAMEEELARYAATAQGNNALKENGADEEDPAGSGDRPKSPVRSTREGVVTGDFQPETPDSARDELLYESIISSPPAQYMTIDGKSARDTLEFVKLGIQEFGDEILLHNAQCRGCDTISPCESHDDVRNSESGVHQQQQVNQNNSNTNDVSTSMPVENDVLFSQEEEITQQEMQRRRDMWMRRQEQQQTE